MIDAFWSDQHFGHKNIIEYSKRPFNSVEEMNEAMIANYNTVVGPNDVCLWGGDCFMGAVDGKQILSRLNGIKLLILGNHDKSGAVMFDMGFSAVCNEMFLKMAGRNVRVSHYAYYRESELDRHGREVPKKYLERQKKFCPPRVKGEVLIHGHTHQVTKRRENMVHIGVDAWNFTPATWDEVEAEVAKI